MLKDFVENADCFEVDIEALQKDGLLEGIYFSPSFLSLPEEQNCSDCFYFLKNAQKNKFLSFLHFFIIFAHK